MTLRMVVVKTDVSGWNLSEVNTAYGALIVLCLQQLLLVSQYLTLL